MARSTPHVVSGQQVAAASPREVGAPAEKAPSAHAPGLLFLRRAIPVKWTDAPDFIAAGTRIKLPDGCDWIILGYGRQEVADAIVAEYDEHNQRSKAK